MKLTDLEYAVIQKYCSIEKKPCPERGELEVVNRDRNPVGFMTDISGPICDEERIFPSRVYEKIPDAITEVDSIDVGFVLFKNDDGTMSIEGYANGEKWPSIEFPIRFTTPPKRIGAK